MIDKERIKLVKNFIIILLWGITLFSCEKDFSPLAQHTKQAVALNEGNIFYYHGHNAIHDSDSLWTLAEWFGYDEVMRDSIINNNRHIVLNYNILSRADKNKLYDFENGREVTLLDFNVQIGDTVDFYNSKVIVEDISKKPALNLNQTVISVSSKKLNSDTLITGMYTRQFGLLTSSRSNGQFSEGCVLLGAVINGIEFGKVH